MNENAPLTDQIANISPLAVLGVVAAFTFLRLILRRLGDHRNRGMVEVCDTVTFVLTLAFLLIRPFVAQAFYIPSESMENTLLKGDRLVVDKVTYRFAQPARGDVIVFQAPKEATGGVEGTDFIKRCVAVPGDRIEVRPPVMKLDGEVLDTVSEFGFEAHEFLRRRLDLSESASIKFFPDHVLVDGKMRMDLTELAVKIGRPGAKMEVTPGTTLVNGKPADESFTREDPDYFLDQVQLGPGQYFMLGDNRNRSQDSHRWGPLDGHRMVGKARVVFWPPSRIGIIR